MDRRAGLTYSRRVSGANPSEFALSTPLNRLYGVGAERCAQLARLGLLTLEDLFLHAPRRYEDRRHCTPIADLQADECAVVRGTIVACGVKYWSKRTRSLFELVLEDGTRRLHCQWYNCDFLERVYARGQELAVYGKVSGVRPFTMRHPEVEILDPGEEPSLHMNRIVPVYPLTEGLPQRWLRSLVWRNLQAFGRLIVEPHPGSLPEGFVSRLEAVRRLQFPDTLAEPDTARRRLAFDEFLELQLRMLTRRRNLQANAPGLVCRGDNRWIKPFLGGLSFKLTEAQTRVLREIRADLGGPHPMRRLLQGDVGSGKTVVAACAALMALESGCSVALMAPTEILAEQHWRNFQRWFDALGITVHLRTGSRKTETECGPTARSAAPALYVGTHALITEGVELENLGLVIIDEQHKFGVTQREALVRKGIYPHLLVMTATPIPRTLGLTLYGDLDVSVIDELPMGRGVIKTFVRTPDTLPKVWEFIRQKLATGRQAYVVYPRVEEGDLKSGAKAVREEYETLVRVLAPWKVGLLYGRLRPEEKEKVMADFRANQVQVLLATSVIEVGVDVPNATMMLVENAEQFGLAQLHQLRGRIGRGAHDSYCILVASRATDAALARLRVLADTTDGFRIAEADLALRGPGELLGQEQSGVPTFKFGDLRRDLPLIELARETAKRILTA
ncbi:MAG: ATP-dependent DNA helicase RecG [Verrucomicrobiota bacterium]